ncbi:MAG: class I SAM-dependent methyltransferase, partial [Porphyrobacter sp.]|nr:class I SAM-dependent methyltransferase [Porphyrobacter sp.]
MTDPTHGYDVSVGYTFGFVREMAPDWLDFCAGFAGRRSPRSERAGPFRFLELGSGQGFNLCLLAAANPHGEFLGIDFLPEHVAHGQALAEAAGLANVRFDAGDFVDLAADWPGAFGLFDYVVLHGVYTWVSPEVRAAVVRCLEHATRPGSLVYNGYNAQPGWLGSMPFQHIALLLKQTSGRPGEEVFAETIATFDRLLGGGAATFRILPGLKARVDSAKARKSNYLVHEFLHEGWSPLWHSEVARDLALAGFAYAGTATMAEMLLPAALPGPLREAIAAQTDDTVRQDLQDFVINQALRRDLFVREPSAAPPGEALTEIPIHLLARPAAGAALEVRTTFGELSLPPAGFAG